MASRSRNLVSRARLNEDSTPARGRQRDENREPTALPPYESPSCPLTATGRRALDGLLSDHDYSNYKKHIGKSLVLIPSTVQEANDRVTKRQDKVARATEKRRLQERNDEDKTEHENTDELMAKQWAKHVKEITANAEKAMRDLIDHGDELAMQENLLTGVSDTIKAAPIPTPRPVRAPRQRRSRDDSDEEEEEPPTEDEEDLTVLSATELMKKAKEDYTTNYNSRTMLQRYGDTNEYIGFKRAVHEALNPGENAKPLPKASRWFPQDPANGSAQQDEEEESDEDVYISGVKEDYKDPLSLQAIKNPYTSRVCNHTYEKDVITEYINTQGTHFASTQARGHKEAEKQVKCVQPGCNEMLKLSEFYEDFEVARKIQRAERQAAYEAEDEDDDDQAPRGTQAGRPEKLDSDEEEAPRSKRIYKIKRERYSRRAVPSSDVEMDD